MQTSAIILKEKQHISNTGLTIFSTDKIRCSLICFLLFEMQYGVVTMVMTENMCGIHYVTKGE